ncbi:MAG: diacylglycerol kinase [Clostridia bacterium]|nr:diacylglycerol kinase [Clostridia bacterium]
MVVAKFRVAMEGIFYTVRTQVNMKVHLLAMMVVIGLGWYFKLKTWEWISVIIVITMVLAAETFNTALEVTVNLYTDKYHPLAKIAKDVAAGAVLITALGAVAVGWLVFGPRLGF